MPSAPSLLLILTTQWRAQAFGYAGDPNARTPHLDALAAASWNFCQAVTPHPFGPFARAALLTGVPSPENGLRDYYDSLPPGAPTVARDLARAGYATAFFGKWHLAPREPTASLVGEAHARTLVPPKYRGGFDLWEGFESGFLLNHPWLHGTRLPEPTRFEGYQSDVICDRAIEWLAALPSRPSRSAPGKGASHPWFCVVSLEAPHPPYDAPAAGIAPRDASALVLPANVPRGGEIEARARRELSGYYAHGEATDRALGRLLSRVDLASTVVVFTSVHGDMHGAHGLFRKGWPHEESVRVPLLVRMPGGAGRPVADAASLADLPVMLRGLAAGAVSPVFKQPAARASISMPSVVRLPLQCDRVWHGVRTPARKLILNPDGSPWLFFDLEKDPLERNNLAADPAFASEIEGLRNL